MDEKVYVAELLDCYRTLLTDKQADIMNLYYEEDLSLAEITDHYDITRQAVLDNIKRSVKQLKNYESKLGLVQKTQLISEVVSEIDDLCNSMSDRYSAERIASIIHKLED